jgi:serine/threonine protein kinase
MIAFPPQPVTLMFAEPSFSRSKGTQTMSREKQVSQLLLQWEEAQINGTSVSPEQLCADCPELLEELKGQITIVKAMNPVLDVTPMPDNSTLAFDTQPQSNPAAQELPTIPGYEVLSELGVGGQGVVYKVRHLITERIEALKMMRMATTRQAQRFLVEIRANAALKHPNVVPILDAREDEGQLYFTMEFAEEGNLAEHLDDFQADQKAAVQLLAKVVHAVHFLHANDKKKIIHRDLKPANILLKKLGKQDKQFEPLVSDFGLAKIFNEEIQATAPEAGNYDPHLTRTGVAVGTPYYMSPEQANGKEIKETTDVWALGVILYELLSGQRPFVGKTNTAICQAVLKGEMKRPHEVKPKLDKHLEAICLNCLTADPTKRYQTAEALAVDLERWLAGDAILPEPMLIKVWRKVRRHPLLSCTLIFCSLLPVIALAALNTMDPDRPLKELQRQVSQGKPVTLVGPNGPPQWSRWVLNEGGISNSPARDETFYFHALDITLLELLPLPLPECYSVSAQVRHHYSDNGEVGIYFGHRKRSTSQGWVHCYCSLAFADIGKRANIFNVQGGQQKFNLVELTLDRYREAGLLPADSYPASTGISKEYPASDNELPWRTLTVNVTPATIDLLLENASIGTLAQNKRLETARRV